MGKRHGYSNTTTWVIWQNAKQRCFNKKTLAYRYYGARGIMMCERWRQSFAAFVGDMGLRPSREHTLGRIDNDGHYEPSNCRWETIYQQNNNTRQNRFLTWKGQTLTIAQWSRKTGLPRKLLSARVNYYRWSDERALSYPNLGHQRPGLRQPKGEAHPMAKLTNADVMRIRQLHEQGLTGRAIAKIFSVSTGSVSLIVNRKHWAHI